MQKFLSNPFLFDLFCFFFQKRLRVGLPNNKTKNIELSLKSHQLYKKKTLNYNSNKNYSVHLMKHNLKYYICYRRGKHVRSRLIVTEPQGMRVLREDVFGPSLGVEATPDAGDRHTCHSDLSSPTPCFLLPRQLH